MVREDGSVACQSCGSVDEQATAILRGQRADLENVEKDLRGKRRRIKELQAEQDEALKASPHYDVAMRVLERWKERVMPGARELTGNHRLENVIARLRGKYTEEECMQAIEGYARFPFVVNRQRSPVGETDQWFADAELIFRTPKHVNSGIAYYKKGQPVASTEALARLSWRRVQQANRLFIVGKLRALAGTEGLEIDGGLLELPCPRCAAAGAEGSPWLQVSPVGSSQLVRCHSCGITDAALIEFIDRLERIDAPVGQGQLELARG